MQEKKQYSGIENIVLNNLQIIVTDIINLKQLTKVTEIMLTDPNELLNNLKSSQDKEQLLFSIAELNKTIEYRLDKVKIEVEGNLLILSDYLKEDL